MKLFKTELEAWHHIWGPQNRNLRRRMTRAFWKLFPEGQKTSLRPFVELCTDQSIRLTFKDRERTKFLQSIHYRAFDLLTAYGKDYVPLVHYRRPKFGEPKPYACFYNARLFAEICKLEEGLQKPDGVTPQLEPVVYVEGIAMGPFVNPMLHAWNALGTQEERAYDWTFYSATKWTRYFGIPLRTEEYDRATKYCYVRSKVHLLFKKKHFPKVESYLEDLLATRKERQTKT